MGLRILALHPWNVSPKKAVQIQKKLRLRIKISPLTKQPLLIAGADASFNKKTAIGIVVVMTYPKLEVLETVRKEQPIRFPYIPTLLAFREGPVLLKCFQSLKKEPDLIIFDGQGTAHQRRMGLATHLGILLSKSTIGCAKKRLTGTLKKLGEERGSYSYIKDINREIIGAMVRTKDNVKPVFVSPGHKIDLKDAIDIVLGCTKKYRIPEPLRYAHHLTKVS